MNLNSLGSRAFALLAGVALLAASALASADPPSQVIRLGYTTGAVSFSPAGEDDWTRATLNRPLTIGDRVWVDAGGRAELQIGGAMLRLNGPSGVTVLNLEDNLTQLQLTQGALNVRVRRLDPEQVIEIDTPNLAFTMRQPGSYRVVVDADGNATDVVVRNGRAEVYGDGASYVVDSRQSYRFYDTALKDYEQYAAPGLDDFDRWASDRDRRFDTSVSARYVSPDVIGYQDLDTYGTWRNDPSYGNVWVPTRVAADWAPYRDGHWAWVDPWGWTWVDDAPWGFAVSHYGRWARLGNNWGWVPGPARTRAYYAPALVAFVGGNNFQLSISTGNVGAVGWFPLGPREVYRPWYSSSRQYFERVNVSNTVVNTTVINNYYNNTNVTNVNYVNRGVPGAVVAVPTTAFVQSQQVARSAVRMTPQMAASAPVTQVAAVVPTERSVRGSAAQAGAPPARVFERQVVARTAPAAVPANFAAQRSQLEKQPGKPLDEAARKDVVRSAPAMPGAPVKVVTQSQAASPTAAPPAAPAGVAGREDRARRTQAGPAGAPTWQEKGAPAQVAQPGAAPTQPGAAPTQPAERGKGRDRGQPTEAAPGTPPPMAAPGQPRVGSPAQTRIQPQQQPPAAAAPQGAPEAAQPRTPTWQQPQDQARQAEQQKAREAQAAQQQQQQQTRFAEQQKAREAQAAQQQQQQQQQQVRQAEQQKAREAQAAQQQQARQAAQQQQQTRFAEQQKAREAQAAQQQQQQQARQAQQAEQQARQAQAAQQQQQARQAAQQQQAQPQAQPQPQRQPREADAKGRAKDEEQKREEEARRQKG